MNVEFTPAFIAHAKKQAAKQNYNAMFIHAKKVGCNGLAYVFEPVSEGVFSSASPEISFEVDGFVFNFPTIQTYIFNGAKFDIVKEGLNRRVSVSNPNATSECGCGASFSVK